MNRDGSVPFRNATSGAGALTHSLQVPPCKEVGIESLWFCEVSSGLLEHVTDGRLSVWEYATYTFVLALADHRTGCWHGDGRILSQIMKCSWRQSRLNLQSLIKKNYLIKLESLRRGSYTLYIDKYFLMASPCHQTLPHGMTVPPRRHDHATILQEENKQIQEAQPKPLRVIPVPSPRRRPSQRPW